MLNKDGINMTKEQRTKALTKGLQHYREELAKLQKEECELVDLIRCFVQMLNEVNETATRSQSQSSDSTKLTLADKV